MAACAHVWHYKCVRRLIHSPEYPVFQCPNCRAYTDLSAEVDDSNDNYENDALSGPADVADNPTDQGPETDGNSSGPDETGAEQGAGSSASTEDDLAIGASNLRIEDDVAEPPEPREQEEETATTTTSRRNEADDDTPQTTPTSDNNGEESTSTAARSPNIDIPSSRQEQLSQEDAGNHHNGQNGQSPGVGDTFEDCPLTPRNDLGPLALDSRAGRL